MPIARAAREAGVSEATLRRAVHAGLVDAVRDGGRLTVRRSEVIELRTRLRKRVPKSVRERERASGETAARAFGMFADATPLEEVVVRLAAPPEVVKELFARWCELREMTRRWLGTPSTPVVLEPPRLDHQPNHDWTCCEGHVAQRQMREGKTK
jgi:hypothetical protein